jgi:hypothetical protein
MFSAMMLAAATTSCPAERAIYTMKEAPGVELRLPKIGPAVSVASDLYAELRLPADGGRTARTIWFLFAVSNGYQAIRLAPVTEPVVAGKDGVELLEDPGQDDSALAGLTRFLAFGDDLAAADGPPSSGQPAPAHILLPDIGLALWYNAKAFGLHDAAGSGISVPTAMFHRTGCD